MLAEGAVLNRVEVVQVVGRASALGLPVALLLAVAAAGCSATTGSPSTTASAGLTASPASATCPAGSDPDQPGDATQVRPALREWYLLAAMDPTHPRIVAGASGFEPEGAGTASLLATWAFDVCTNTWTELVDTSWPSPEERPALGQFVSDPGAGVVRGIPVWWTPVWTFDPATGSWSAPPAGDSGSEAWPMAVYDPDGERMLAVDPNVLTAAAARGEPGSSGVLTYDVAAKAWTDLGLAEDSSTPKVLMDSYDVAFDSAAHRLALVVTRQDSRGEAARTGTFDPVARSWSQGADVPDTLAGGYPGSGWAAAFDPETERTLWFADTAMLGYDATDDDWVLAERDAGWPESMTIGDVEVDPAARIVGTMVYDPVNERLVVMAGHVRPVGDPVGGFVPENSMVTADDVWAYEPATNTWAMLLAPSAAPASYGPG